MEEFFEKMKSKGWWATNDQKLMLLFREENDIPLVYVKDMRTKYWATYSYIVVPTRLSDVFTFETPTGRFVIAVMDDEKLFLSPNGAYLLPYYKTGIKCHEILVNPEGTAPKPHTVKVVFTNSKTDE